MKTIFFLIASSILVFYVSVYDIKNSTWDKYCAKLRDGKIIVIMDGMELTSDITLENGTIIRTDGTVIKTDDTKMVLQDGECVDNDGNMIEPKSD